MPKYKIMQVLTDTNIGGAGVYLLNYLKARSREDFETTVILPHGAALYEAVKETGARVIEADNIADRSYSKAATETLCEIFRAEKPNLVHTHASLSARIAAKKCKIPVVSTRHCLEERKPFPKNVAYRLLNNYLSDRVIAVSKAVEQNLLRDGISPKKLRMIYNGIPPQPQYSDERRKEFRDLFGFEGNRLYIGIVARLEKVKNHDLFLDAARECLKTDPNLMFIVAGDGSRRDELQKKAKDISQNVRFLGQIEEVSRLFCALDVAVLTSTHEALSLSLLEAMAQKRAVVSTRSGGPEEFIVPNENGFLCEHTAESLSKAILALCASKTLREKLGGNGKKTAEKFTSSVMAEKIEAVYRELTVKE